MASVAPRIDRAFCSEWFSLFFVPKELEEFVKERRSIENTLIRIYELEDIKDIMFRQNHVSLLSE